MPKPTPKFTVPEMLDALEKAGGLYYLAARHLKCSAKTVQKYVDRHAVLKDIASQKKGERVDMAEGILWQKVQMGEAWAVIFFLKTQGRDRGYTERYEFSHQFRGMTDAELADWIAQRTGTDRGSLSGGATSGLGDPEPDATVH